MSDKTNADGTRKALAVVGKFGDFSPGDIITDAAAIERIEASPSDKRHCVRMNLPAQVEQAKQGD